jgi:hypothetical protein
MGLVNIADSSGMVSDQVGSDLSSEQKAESEPLDSPACPSTSLGMVRGMVSPSMDSGPELVEGLPNQRPGFGRRSA